MSYPDPTLGNLHQRELLDEAAKNNLADSARRGERRPKRSSNFRWGFWLIVIAVAVVGGTSAWLLSILPSTNAIGILRDVLVVAYLFILRLGVPLLITLMFGSFLQHWLKQQDAKEILAQQGFQPGSKPCWVVKNCPAETRANCPAYQRPDLPCWLALQVAGYGLKEQCYSCPLYTTQPAVINVARS